MKLVKKFAVAVLFVSVLALPTFAGDLDTPGKTSTTTTTTTSDSTTTTTTAETAPAGTSDGTSEVSNLLYDAYTAILGLY
jgi:hypothetical protein